MKLRVNEYNYERLANKYKLDIYEDNNRYNLFSDETGEILAEGLTTEEEAVRETINVFNENIRNKIYLKGHNKIDLFKYYPLAKAN